MNNLESLLVFLFIGLVAGWLAGILVKGRGFGLLGDILVGVIGAELGGFIFSRAGLSAYGFTGAVITAFIGAVVLLAVVKLVVNVGSARTLSVVLLLLASCLPAQAVTTVTVDAADFEGEIEKIDRSTRMLDVIDTEGRTRQVLVTQETIDTYRTGDFVRIRPIAGAREVAFIREESNRDLEGRIINVDNSQNTIVVRDAQDRERRVKLKQGMINNYKVDDYVRIHLMADLKEAKMVRTIK